MSVISNDFFLTFIQRLGQERNKKTVSTFLHIFNYKNIHRHYMLCALDHAIASSAIMFRQAFGMCQGCALHVMCITLSYKQDLLGDNHYKHRCKRIKILLQNHTNLSPLMRIIVMQIQIIVTKSNASNFTVNLGIGHTIFRACNDCNTAALSSKEGR